MSTWNDIKKTIGLVAEKTATKTRELTDTASLKIKIASREADRDTEYKRLGKLTYTKLKSESEESSESLTIEISQSIEKLDEINAEINSLRAEEEARRAAKEEEKAQKAAEREAREKEEDNEEQS